MELGVFGGCSVIMLWYTKFQIWLNFMLQTSFISLSGVHVSPFPPISKTVTIFQKMVSLLCQFRLFQTHLRQFLYLFSLTFFICTTNIGKCVLSMLTEKKGKKRQKNIKWKKFVYADSMRWMNNSINSGEYD